MNEIDILQRRFNEMLSAYEELLTIKNGRTTRANRTRQKLKRKGVIQCLEDWAVGIGPTMGFDLLVKNGMGELTGEYLVAKHPDRFSRRAVEGAKARLHRAGVKLPA